MVMLMTSNQRFKAEDVKNGQSVTILTEGEWVKDKFKDQPETNAFVVSAKIGDVTKDLKITKASRENLKESWGPETKAWIGKQSLITLVPMEKGKSIMLTPVVSAEEIWGDKK